jgi:hypothetical protein
VIRLWEREASDRVQEPLVSGPVRADDKRGQPAARRVPRRPVPRPDVPRQSKPGSASRTVTHASRSLSVSTALHDHPERVRLILPRYAPPTGRPLRWLAPSSASPSHARSRDEAAGSRHSSPKLDAKTARVSDAALIEMIPYAPGLLGQALATSVRPSSPRSRSTAPTAPPRSRSRSRLRSPTAPGASGCAGGAGGRAGAGCAVGAVAWH